MTWHRHFIIVVIDSSSRKRRLYKQGYENEKRYMVYTTRVHYKTKSKRKSIRAQDNRISIVVRLP